MIETVHPKVKAATVASLAVSIVGATLVWVQDNPAFIGQLPKFWQGLIFLLVPPLLTFAAGYQQSSYDSPPPQVPPQV